MAVFTVVINQSVASGPHLGKEVSSQLGSCSVVCLCVSRCKTLLLNCEGIRSRVGLPWLIRMACNLAVFSSISFIGPMLNELLLDLSLDLEMPC